MTHQKYVAELQGGEATADRMKYALWLNLHKIRQCGSSLKDCAEEWSVFICALELELRSGPKKSGLTEPEPEKIPKPSLTYRSSFGLIPDLNLNFRL